MEHKEDRKHKRKFNKKNKEALQLAEEHFLENIVFGAKGDVLSHIDKGVNIISVDVNDFSKEKEIENQLFFEDLGGDVTLDNNSDYNDDEDDDEYEYNFKIKKNIIDYDDKYEKEDNDNVSDNLSNKDNKTEQNLPAWADEDDDVEINQIYGEKTDKYPKKVLPDQRFKDYLEDVFSEVHQEPEWTKKKNQKNENDYDSDDDKLERTARDFKQKKQRGVLEKDFLHVKKCQTLNQSSKIKTALNNVQFHPKSSVALLGSNTGLVRIFQVDGKVNTLLQSIYFRGYRLHDAKFISGNGREEIIVASDGSQGDSVGFCYYYDMIAGKIVRVKLTKGARKPYSLKNLQVSPDSQYIAATEQNSGVINILSARTKEHIAEFNSSIDVECLTFSSDSNYMFAHGRNSSGMAYVWDIRNLKSHANPCVNRFMDVGTVEGTCMASSSELFAVGSNMGVVNIYKLNEVIRKSQPEVVKTVMNLTTSISSLKFNHDGQLLMLASDQQNDAIRIMNTRFGTVYKNFPSFVGGTTGKTYGRIYDLDISPNSGFVSWATGAGTGHLFKILEYPVY